jgi:apolipoprotein N-acyltransferase
MNISASFIWLLLGGGLQVFGFGRWMTPLAAWLMPVFILHFSHATPPLSGMLWVWLTLTIAVAVGNRGVVPIPSAAYLAVPTAIALSMMLSFLVDRLLAPLVPGFGATLVFPVAWTALEFLGSRFNPYGTWGSLGYTQHGNVPLMQLASVTGIWGIGFLVCWFAAVVNWAWDQQFDWGSVQHGVLGFAAVWSVITLLGGLRLAFATAPMPATVRIAGVGWPGGIVEPPEFLRAIEPDLDDAEHDRLRAAFLRIQDSFFTRSQREARAGARIIVWPEANLMVFKEDAAALLERARAFARQNEVYLLMGLVTLSPGAEHSFENQSVLLTPTGDTAYAYTKATAVPGFEKKFAVPGDGTIPVADTPYGRIASPICFDLDFDALIRQVGRAKTDLMLVPASDWKEITRLHQTMAEFRAIENGAALFRITRWGGSGAVDPYGRRLAWMDDFSTRDSVMVAQVPTKAGVRTLYARIGDVFAWACVASLVAGVGWFAPPAL